MTAPAATSIIKPNPDGSYDRNIVNPDAFKQRIVQAHPGGTSSDGTPYANIDAKELVQRAVKANPHGITKDGIPYVAFTDPGAMTGPTDTLAGHPILKGTSDFLGTSGLGKGITQAIYLNFTKEGKQLAQDLKDGKISYDDFNNAIGGLAKPEEVVGSAMQTASDVIIPSGTGSWLSQALKWAGVGALSGAGSAVEQGKGAADITKQALETGLTSGIVAPTIGKVAGAIADKATGSLPERLYSQFFKTTTDEFAKGMTSDAAKILQKSDPELFDTLVKRGIVKVDSEGAIQVSKSTAQKALEAGISGSPKAMGAQVAANTMTLEGKVQDTIRKAPDIQLNAQYKKSLLGLLTAFKDRIGASEGGVFAKALTDPLDSAIAAVKSSKGTLAAEDALSIRRMLDAMQKARAYVPDANLSVSDSILKNATSFLRRSINALPGMGDIMGQYADNMSMLTDLQKRGAQLENTKVLNLFDLMAVTEGAQTLGEAGKSIGGGLTFDAVLRFLTSATGGTNVAQGLYKAGQAAATPLGQGVGKVAGAGTDLAALNIFKDIFANSNTTPQ